MQRIHTYHCLDAVCQTKDIGGSVLIRAIQPLEGIPIMKKYRMKSNIIELAIGPGKLCIALNIDESLDGIDLTSEVSHLKICGSQEAKSFDIATSKRIGITKSKDAHLRFYIPGNQFISR